MPNTETLYKASVCLVSRYDMIQRIGLLIVSRSTYIVRLSLNNMLWKLFFSCQFPFVLHTTTKQGNWHEHGNDHYKYRSVFSKLHLNKLIIYWTLKEPQFVVIHIFQLKAVSVIHQRNQTDQQFRLSKTPKAWQLREMKKWSLKRELWKKNYDACKIQCISPSRTRRAARIIVSDRIIQRLMSNDWMPAYIYRS